MSIAFTYRADLGLQQRQVGAQDIADAERALGVILPQSFKDFLLAHDGPTPSPGWFRAITPKGTVWYGPVVQLLSTSGPKVRRLGQRTACLEMVTQQSRNDERLSTHYVIIGHMYSQPRMLLISTAAADSGTVYAWRAGEKRFRPDQIVRLAGSFTEFLGSLTDPPAEVAAVFSRNLADTLQEMAIITDDVAFPHLKLAQALRNVRPYIDLPSIQKIVDAGLDEVNNTKDERRQIAQLRALIGQVQDALRANTGRVGQ